MVYRFVSMLYISQCECIYASTYSLILPVFVRFACYGTWLIRTNMKLIRTLRFSDIQWNVCI